MSNVSVLLVEDNLPDVYIMRQAIQDEGIAAEFAVAKDGEEALERITKWSDGRSTDRPDVVIMDINLPKYDGFEVLRHIRASQILKDTPVLVVTSSDSSTDRVRASELNATYFKKPSTYDEFLQIGKVIAKILQRHTS